MENTGTLKIYLYLAIPQIETPQNPESVKYERKTVFTAHCVTLDEAREYTNTFNHNNKTKHGSRAVWQENPIDLD